MLVSDGNVKNPIVGIVCVSRLCRKYFPYNLWTDHQVHKYLPGREYLLVVSEIATEGQIFLGGY